MSTLQMCREENRLELLFFLRTAYHNQTKAFFVSNMEVFVLSVRSMLTQQIFCPQSNETHTGIEEINVASAQHCAYTQKFF